jgi:two-component system, OmpR family, sensor kinase
VSLRARLVLAVGAVALVALVVADVVTYTSLRSFLYDRVDQQMDAAHPPIEQALNRGLPIHSLSVAEVAPGLYVEERTPGGQVIGQPLEPRHPGSSSAEPELPAHVSGLSQASSRPPTAGSGAQNGTPPGEGAPGGPPSGTSQGGEEPHTYLTVGSTSAGGPAYRVRVSSLANGNQLVLAVPLTDTIETLHHLVYVEMAVTGGALFAAALIGWWLVRVGLRPLREVEQTADAIAEGELDRRVDEGRPGTEVGRLARAFNAMVTRIESAFAERDATEDELRRSEARLRRFVADASHELRTPLSAVAGYAELFDRGAADRPEDLSRVVKGIRAETDRMGVLVSDLLLLARLDEGRPLDRHPVELVSLAAEALDAARAAGPDWPVVLEAEKPVEVQGDAARLRQVVDNLLTNVRSHTPPRTRAVLRVSEADGEAVVEVEDEGSGLSDGQAAQVFERFFRADASRSRQHGGTGLGLAIVSAIVAAHGGRVEVGEPTHDGAGEPTRDGVGEPTGTGALFRVVIPAEAPADETEERAEEAAEGAERTGSREIHSRR